MLNPSHRRQRHPTAVQSPTSPNVCWWKRNGEPHESEIIKSRARIWPARLSSPHSSTVLPSIEALLLVILSHCHLLKMYLKWDIHILLQRPHQIAKQNRPHRKRKRNPITASFKFWTHKSAKFCQHCSSGLLLLLGLALVLACFLRSLVFRSLV